MSKSLLACCTALLLASGCKGRAKALPVAGAAVLAAPVALIERPVEPAPVTASSVDANVALPPAEAPGAASLCNEQKAQPFLMRAHFDSNYALGEEHRKQWAQVLGEAVRYRTEQYGYVEGYGRRAWNSRTPAEQARVVTFFGVPVTIHARVAPALACAEVAIKAHCQAEPYQPAVLSGMRKRNTYLNGEISNHVYGIAIDVDPMRNPCCGCIGSWRTNLRCQNQKSKFERMDMPKCWIKQFERFGFYWLGNDRIEDTMHFEFLADPSKILP